MLFEKIIRKKEVNFNGKSEMPDFNWGFYNRIYSIIGDTPKALIEHNSKPVITYFVEKFLFIKGGAEWVVKRKTEYK